MIDALAAVRDCIRSGQPAVLATAMQLSAMQVASVQTGVNVPFVLGAKIVVRPRVAVLGSLGEPTLDAVVVRDAEIIALRTRSVVPSLRDRTGAIHQVRS